MIVPGHWLIKTGPYRYLVHPSYIGVLLCMMAFQGALFDQHWVWIQALVPFVDLPWWSGAVLYSWFLSRIFTTRARNEDALMAAHFGEEWDEYVKERWRFPTSSRRPIPPGRPSAPFPYLASQFEIPPRGIPVYKPLSTTTISQYSLKNTATTIRALLLEWIAGLSDCLSIQELNRDLGTLWRVRGERNLYNSRATIVREFKRLVEEGSMMEEEAVSSLQVQLGKNAFLTLSKRIGQENKALGRYQEESMTPRAVAARNRSQRRKGGVEEEGGEEEEEEEEVEVEEEEEVQVDIFDGPEQHEDYSPFRGTRTSTMGSTQEQHEDEFAVVDDESDRWREVKEEEPVVEPRSRNTKESGDGRSKSKKRRRLDSSRVKKVAFDGMVKVDESYSRVKLEIEDSP
ncbi:hypothetical protein BG006_009939 [Podila minutissima]|uniref:Protein-S-isoprenylcysteine O-methyltransferase n=1 Tax=Podila minutissima TaxID=64525 RepID=A0A9P5SE16_9FUNG|nr:hypothetical protein BG006_009939 [Podila minutissima]